MISKPVLRSNFSFLPTPVTIPDHHVINPYDDRGTYAFGSQYMVPRKNRSQTSNTLCQVIVSGSISKRANRPCSKEIAQIQKLNLTGKGTRYRCTLNLRG